MLKIFLYFKLPEFSHIIDKVKKITKVKLTMTLKCSTNATFSLSRIAIVAHQPSYGRGLLFSLIYTLFSMIIVFDSS